MVSENFMNQAYND